MSQLYRILWCTAFGVILIALTTTVPGDYEEEVFASVRIQGKTYKNVRVVKSDPVQVLMTFEGGMTTVKRQDLPPEFAAKYPFHPDEAKQWEALTATKEKTGKEQDRAAIKSRLKQKELELQVQLDVLQNSLVELQKELDVLNASANKRPRSPERLRANAARETKIGLLRAIRNTKAMLEQVRAMLNASI